MISVTQLPALNATLNAISAILLSCGFAFIRARNIKWHKVCMLGACVTSTAFLISYLTYHFHVGSVRFQRFGWIRPLYFIILFSHTVLAAVVVPLVLVTLYRALSRNFDRHKRVARWTLPLWLYVSVTGVMIYWMLYHL